MNDNEIYMLIVKINVRFLGVMGGGMLKVVKGL